MIGRYLLTFIAISSLLSIVSTVECNASTMNFVSRFSLGKQDEFNRTFTKIQSKLQSLPGINYSSPNGANYSIMNIKPSYYYRDSKQKATSSGEDTIVLEGGYAEVDLTFEWKIASFTTTNGTGSAAGLSDELILAKKLVIDNKSYSY